MDWPVRSFVKASLAWLAAGVTLGVAMAAHPAWTVYRTAHVHMNLLGFVSMMIFGVAYHVVPRFSGHPLTSRRLAVAHWWLANVGLGLMAGGFLLRARGVDVATVVLATGGVLEAAGAYAFVWNLWRTIDGPAGMRRVAAAQAGAPPSRRPPVAVTH